MIKGVFSDEEKLDEGAYEIPRPYIDIDKDIFLSEVKLGPKVERAHEVEAWLNATGKMKKVTHSSRNYR